MAAIIGRSSKDGRSGEDSALLKGRMLTVPSTCHRLSKGHFLCVCHQRMWSTLGTFHLALGGIGTQWCAAQFDPDGKWVNECK